MVIIIKIIIVIIITIIILIIIIITFELYSPLGGLGYQLTAGNTSTCPQR